MADIHCIIVTPESTAVDEQADFIALPLFDGEIGIGFGHSPMIGRLGYGELRIKKGSTESRYYVDGGFVQVDDNVVSVLTNRAIPSTEVDRTAAQTQLEEAQKQPANTPQLREIRERLEAQARGQLRVSRK
jgi:F-type H+-transporting ATPase subunit epsilon